MWLMFVNRNHAMFVFQKMTSGVRQNFHQDCEAAINRQINLELYASYVYLSMVRPKACSLQRQWHCHAHFHLTTRFRFSLQSHASLFKVYTIVFFFLQSYYFDRDDIALNNFAKFFRHQSHEEREHAEKLMKLQNERGGRIFLQDVRVRPWGNSNFPFWSLRFL